MRHMVGKLAAAILLGAALFAGTGVAAEPVKVTLSGHPAPHSMPLYIGIDKGWFAEEGLDVDTLVYISGPPQMEAVPSGAWQVGCAGMPATITGVLGFNNAVLGFSTWDHPAQTLYARPDSPIAQSGKGHFPNHPEIYGTADDYRGARILGTRGTLGHLQAMATLDAVGLTEEDVEIIHMEIPAAFQAFKAGEGDAIILWSTFAALAEEEGWVQISSAEKAGFPVPSVIQATESAQDPEVIQKIMNVWVRAMFWYQENKKEAAELYHEICQEEGINATPEFCLETINMHDIPSLAQMEEWLGNRGFENIVDQILKFFVKAGSYTEAEREQVVKSFNLSYLAKAIENYKQKYM